MKPIILFGVEDFAELAYYYLTTDSPYKVVAFTVHEKYMKCERFNNLPVTPFEELEKKYPPEKYDLFAPMMAKRMNTLREKVYLEGKEKGYDFISYVSSKATVFNSVIGDNCFILENNTIQPFTEIGNNVVLWSGNHIGHHGIVKDHAFFTSHVVMSGHCVIGENCFLGVNSTIRDGSNLAKGTLLSMSSSLTLKETEEWGVYIGHPAKKKGTRFSYDVF
jgi:sugar O-acyltransferase (sialic acid O-acetyltransferase NeuD family)